MSAARRFMVGVALGLGAVGLTVAGALTASDPQTHTVSVFFFALAVVVTLVAVGDGPEVSQ